MASKALGKKKVSKPKTFDNGDNDMDSKEYPPLPFATPLRYPPLPLFEGNGNPNQRSAHLCST